MKTTGFTVRQGYLVPESLEFAQTYGEVPSFVWSRLKDAARRAGRWDDFAREATAAKPEGAIAERLLFVRWVKELDLVVPAGHYPDQQLWSWTRGWTEQLVDSYLAAPTPHLAIAKEPTP